MNLQDTIQTILTQFGVEVLQQPKRFLSLFSDVAPTLTKEKALLQFVMQPEVMKQFQPCDPRDETARLFAAKRRLEGIVAEDALQQVLDAFAAGLGWTVRCQPSVPVVQTPIVQQMPPTPKQAVVPPETGMTAKEMWQKGRSCYGEGDYEEAVKWYRKSADQGLARAQDYLGDCYYYGRGVPKSYIEAMKWYLKAAEQGLATAQNSLGDCYYYGYSVCVDYTEAVKWYQKAAEQGSIAAQVSLGYCYENGNGLPQNHSEAVKWYRKAAGQGNPAAMFNLGCCYAKGHGVQEDHAGAVMWFLKAADLGSDKAQFYLGNCYELGIGVTKSKEEAVFWYKKAAENGNSEAQKRLMSPLFRLFG